MNPLKEQLRSLPDFDPPPGGWPALVQRLDARQRQPRRLFLLAAAASALLAVGLGVLIPHPQEPGPARQAPLQASAEDRELLRLMERSRELERQLAQLRPQTSVWDARLQARARELERGLTYLDLQLNYAVRDGRSDQTRRLWSNRVDLMAALVATHRNAHLAPGDAFNPDNSI